MTDRVSKETRSKIMSRIRGKNTKPEILLRKNLWHSGHKGYRLNYGKAFGKPDICYVGKRISIFVDGCFWHGCPSCYKKPSSNKKYWSEKLKQNKERDMKANIKLKKEGWVVMRFWECQITKEIDKVSQEIKEKIKKQSIKNQL